ncbi:hypothetical protein BBP40_000894 [Aspergillus hancockii]|nr:hypothetical protein BBP40_000894 [Aspergillus hancockii]
MSKIVKCAIVASDEVIPLRKADYAPHIRDTIDSVTLWFPNTLEVVKLRTALDRLLEIGHWRVLGARLRVRTDNRLEYHLPQKFDQNRPGYILTSTTRATSIKNKLPRASDRPAVVCKVQELDDLVWDPARPARIDDWLYTDSPQLRVHVNNFADATAITLNWPHTLADATGLATFMRAWSATLSGQEDAVPALTPPGEDYLAHLKASTPTEQWVHSHREISRPGFLYLGLRYAIEKLRFPKEESRIVCVPQTFVKQLHTQAHCECQLLSQIFISSQEDMDILTALRLLQKARTEDLQSHHDEVLLMLADVSKRLKSDNSSIGDRRGECISVGSRYSGAGGALPIIIILGV